MRVLLQCWSYVHVHGAREATVQLPSPMGEEQNLLRLVVCLKCCLVFGCQFAEKHALFGWEGMLRRGQQGIGHPTSLAGFKFSDEHLAQTDNHLSWLHVQSAAILLRPGLAYCNGGHGLHVPFSLRNNAV